MSKPNDEMSDAMRTAIEAIKAVALEKLAAMQGFQQARKDFKAAHTAYLSLTGERLDGAPTQGRKQGVPNKSKESSGKSVQYGPLGNAKRPPGTNQRDILRYVLKNPTGVKTGDFERSSGLKFTGATFDRLVHIEALKVHKDKGANVYTLGPKGKIRLVGLEDLLSKP